jgi:thiol-disulfide isomerase/thioredoxin
MPGLSDEGACFALQPRVRSFPIALFLLVAATLGLAAGLPLTAREISLMLRSGYSSEAVLRELSARHFSDGFDGQTEKELKQAGASAALLEKLRSGAYQPSAAQIAALTEKRTAPPQRTSVAAGDLNEVHDAGKRADSAQPASTPPADQVYRVLKGALVSRQRGVFVPFDDEILQSKKLFLYFFSATWSPAGRKFTSRLMEYYARSATQHPEFEVVFFSADRSQFAMETYMNQSDMPWPAVAFPEINAQSAAIRAGHDVPCLILLDSSGKMLSQSSGEDGAGLEKVLSDLDEILARGNR